MDAGGLLARVTREARLWALEKADKLVRTLFSLRVDVRDLERSLTTALPGFEDGAQSCWQLLGDAVLIAQ